MATTDTAKLNGLPVNPIYRGCLAELSESLAEVNSVDIANTDSCFAEKKKLLLLDPAGCNSWDVVKTKHSTPDSNTGVSRGKVRHKNHREQLIPKKRWRVTTFFIYLVPADYVLVPCKIPA